MTRWLDAGPWHGYVPSNVGAILIMCDRDPRSTQKCTLGSCIFLPDFLLPQLPTFFVSQYYIDRKRLLVKSTPLTHTEANEHDTRGIATFRASTYSDSLVLGRRSSTATNGSAVHSDSIGFRHRARLFQGENTRGEAFQDLHPSPG
jgi:hypothetical protein